MLDEPTNHLDLESREALEIALDAFPGTILLVSHDRAVLDAVASRLLAVEDQHIASYPGGWADYVRSQEEEPAAPVSRVLRRSRRSSGRSARRSRGRLRCSSSRRRSHARKPASPSSR